MRRFVTLFLPVLALIAAPLHAGVNSGVTDDGHFFSSQAIHQADDIIAQNREHPHPDIRVVTVATIPDTKKNEFENQGKNAFFEHWADEIGKRDYVNGVVILICKSPAHLQVVQGNETRERAFVDADRRELVNNLVAAFRAKNYDDGLLEAVRFIRDRESANLKGAHRARPPHVAGLPTTQPTSQPAPPATAPTTRP